MALKVSVALENWKLSAPFRISGHVWEDLSVVVVTLEDGPFRGRGEAAGVYYLDDTPVRMAEQIEHAKPQIEAAGTRRALQTLLPPGGARNAVDCAFWELEARRDGTPVWQAAGLPQPRPLLTTFTLGAESPETMATLALSYPQARALKLKLTGELATDIKRVRAVRAARPDVWLGVDANQGYTRDVLPGLMDTLVAARVSLLEQPLKRGREADLDGFRSPVPLAADESVQSFADLAATAGRFQVVNIKLDKCGGLTEGLAMAHEAKRLGLQVMVGNMVGTSLAMAPGFLVGQLCDVVDLDGPIFLSRDRVPSLSYEGGLVFCGDEIWGAAASDTA